MPAISNSKVTSSAIFYNRGVPNSLKSFGKLTTINYTVLRQIVRNNVQNRRPMYSFI